MPSGQQSATALAGATEIVITRNGTNFASIIAELSEIEEIRINGVDPAGTGGTAGGDTFQIIGNFSGTSLRLNTITIDGNAGDDTVDISALTSAHRIVFRSNGGNDTIVGTLRAQDVIELPRGKTPADYSEETDEQGVTTLTCGDHQITYTCSEPPIVRECTAEEPPVEEPPVEEPPVEEPPVEEPPVEQPPVEQPPVEQPPVGRAASGRAASGRAASGRGSGGDR